MNTPSQPQRPKAPSAHPPRRSPSKKSKPQTFPQRLKRAVRKTFRKIKAPILRAWHALDVFRKDELSTILVNSAVAAAALIVVLCLLFACLPSLRLARVGRLIAAGETESALSLLTRLEQNGCSPEEAESLRLSAVHKMIQNARYAEALSLLAELPENEKTQTAQLDCRYKQAASLWDAGDYSGAAQLYYQLGDYLDSASRYADCRCALAVEAYLTGSENDARQLLLSVPEAHAHIETAVQKTAESPEAASALLALELFNPESLSRMQKTAEALAQARSNQAFGRIAAGYRHSVARRNDGTALAAGDNSSGQCDVSGWTNLVQIAAGAYHTVGLTADGTVVACGRNDEGQCDVSDWTDIVMIAASAYDTLGLKADGTVVSCGAHSRLTALWHGVTWITGGSYSAGCLYDQGSMLSTHSASQLDMSVTLYDLAVCGPVAAGILYDGSLITNLDKSPAWNNLISISAGENGLMGLTSDGQVLSFLYRGAQESTLPLSSPAAEIACGGTHSLVLTQDGRVQTFGDNTFGQSDLSAWQLW